MTLAALRRSARSVAVWLLLVSLVGVPHRVDSDDACPPAGAEQHDESKHVFSSDVSSDHPEHCAVCHWLRSVNFDLAKRGVDQSRPDLAASLAPPTRSDDSDGAYRALAARAPPANVN